MKTSVTFTVVLLFLVVSAAFFYLNPFDKPIIQREGVLPAEVSMELLEDQAEDQNINFIQIQNLETKQTITLHRKNEKWQMTFPFSYPAEPQLAEGLVTALKLSKKARKLIPEKNWAEYGLQRPSLKVGIETRPGKRHYLSFGDASPIGRNVFARWDNEKEYFLVSTDLKKAFERSPYSLRLKQIFRTPLQEISKVRIKTESEQYEMTYQNGKWIWVEPVSRIGESLLKAQTDEILAAISDLNVKEFLDAEKKSASKLGLSLISPSIKIWGKGKEKESLQLGNEVPTKEAFYAKREDEKVLLLVARNNIRQLFQMVETFAQGKNEQEEAKPNPAVVPIQNDPETN
jgi:hypothetical protein